MATPTIPDWPSYLDDDGVSNNGTDLDVAFFDALGNAIQASITGEDNPNVFASEIIDEVVHARGNYASLNSRLNQPVVGTIYGTVSASDIIDEVVIARDDNFDLNDRFDNFVADEIPDADATTRGLLNFDAQTIKGDKTIEDDLFIRLGESTTYVHPRLGVFLADRTQRSTSGTGATVASTLAFPANALNEDGDSFDFLALLKPGGNGNAKTLTFTFMGTATTLISGSTQNGGTYVVRGRVVRTSSTAYRIFGTVSGSAAIAPFDATVSSGVDYTADTSIITTITNATAGTTTQDHLEVEGANT